MSRPSLHDQELFRVVLLEGWAARDSDDECRKRLKMIEDVLRKLRWIPIGKTLPLSHEMKAVQRTLWDVEWTKHGQEPEWLTGTFGASYHSEILAWSGVAQEAAIEPSLESTTDPIDAWFSEARHAWDRLIGPREWATRFTPPEALKIEADRPRVLGTAWVWTGEWSEMPAATWAEFGRSVYAHARGDFIVEPWGLLGWAPGDESAPDRFDIHTIRRQCDETPAAAPDPTSRNYFLYDTMPAVLTSYLKADQFIRLRFSRRLRSELNQLDARVHKAARFARSLSIGRRPSRTKKQIVELTSALAEFSSEKALLAADAHAVGIACDTIRRRLGLTPAAAGDARTHRLVESLSRLQDQMTSDREFFDLTERAGEQALENINTFANIDEARETKNLALIAILLSAALSVSQLLVGVDPPSAKWWVVAVGILASLFVWWSPWFR